MGRGRAKAKQTKVARDLKYRTFETDFEQLQRELHGDNGSQVDESSGQESEDSHDPYADDDAESARRH
ncbi:MAG: DUF3073 domain-containing protein [Nocardioidaceae bacterium]